MASLNSTPLQRLQQTKSHLTKTPYNSQTALSLIHGPTDPPLLNLTLSGLLENQVSSFGDKECVVVSWTSARWTYSLLKNESERVAKALLGIGVQKGDRVGILAGNCEEYVSVFFGVAMVGGVLVVLNSTYTATEARYALNHSGCKVLFIQEKYGRHANTELLISLEREPEVAGALERVSILKGDFGDFPTYEQVLEVAGGNISAVDLEKRTSDVNTHDVCNLQYTSGSTGDPKAAMLTHHNLINNSLSIGDRMALTPKDILCCPPPLFHCFGLVLGLLACITHGSTIILPSPTFSAPAVLTSLHQESCTALHGVPAMFEELLSLPRPDGWSCPNLRTGIVAGAPVPRPLMKRMLSELNMAQFTSSYGLTEASPTVFNAFTTDTIQHRLTTVGKLLPHLHAKIVDPAGTILPVGERGELYIAGYSLCQGYWRNKAKTRELLVPDEQGITWLRTGDEAFFTPDGYCTITGRFKDIIIRGGENIYPVEIESRLTSHPSGTVARAAVIGIKHLKYGEVVGAFLLPPDDHDTVERPSDEELRAWVREVLGRHKAPTHVFWVGDEDVGLGGMPQTGSGKVKKHILRDVAQRLVDAELQMEEDGALGLEWGVERYEGWPTMKECVLEF
ncbi:hypothetical protein B0O99DRAFT_600019 [Bisporella sp. PMI_857]|nr:hypothetical protein B0O99DRAFT_600019 [Bisporella sp. PMI_857]